MRRKQVFRDVALELKKSLPEIVRETRKRFLPELCDIEVRITPAPIEEDDELFKVDDVSLLFDFHGRSFKVSYYVAHMLKVWDLSNASPFQVPYVLFKRSETDLEIISSVEWNLAANNATRDFECMQFTVDSLQCIHTMFNGQAECIKQFILNRVHLYASSDLRQRKHIVRILLFSRRFQVGAFASLPLEIVIMICKKII